LGQSLMGKLEGDEVVLVLGNGRQVYELVEVL